MGSRRSDDGDRIEYVEGRAESVFFQLAGRNCQIGLQDFYENSLVVRIELAVAHLLLGVMTVGFGTILVLTCPTANNNCFPFHIRVNQIMHANFPQHVYEVGGSQSLWAANCLVSGAIHDDERSGRAERRRRRRRDNAEGAAVVVAAAATLAQSRVSTSVEAPNCIFVVVLRMKNDGGAQKHSFIAALGTCIRTTSFAIFEIDN